MITLFLLSYEFWVLQWNSFFTTEGFFFVFFFASVTNCYLSILCPQCPTSSQWCAQMSPSSTSSSFTPSLFLASCSSLCWRCATRAATTARAKKARTAPLSFGLKNPTSVTLPPVWTHLLSAYTPAPLTKQGLLPQPASRTSRMQSTQCQGANLDSTFRPYCCSLLCWFVNQLISLKIPTLVAAYFLCVLVRVYGCVREYVVQNECVISARLIVWLQKCNKRVSHLCFTWSLISWSHFGFYYPEYLPVFQNRKSGEKKHCSHGDHYPIREGHLRVGTL